MSTYYEAPKEVTDLEKLINNFAYWNDLNIKDVFRYFLLYIIKQFSLPDSPALTDCSTLKNKKNHSRIYLSLG